MPQMALLYDDEQKAFDLAFSALTSAPDYVGDTAYLTAVNISLFTDRRAPVSTLERGPHGQLEDARGWWGDWLSQSDDQNDDMGSLLWLLERAKDTQDTVNRAQNYAREALQWLTTPAAGPLQAQELAVTATRAGAGLIALNIAISRPDPAGQLLTVAWRYLYNYQTGDYYALEPAKP